MTAFGGIFRSPKLEGVEESDDNGERGRLLGIDLESGVMRVRPARSEAVAEESADESSDPPPTT